MVFCYYLSTQNVLLTRPEKKFALDSRDGEFFFLGGGGRRRGGREEETKVVGGREGRRERTERCLGL